MYTLAESPQAFLMETRIRKNPEWKSAKDTDDE